MNVKLLTREQRHTIATGIFGFVLLLVLMQLWLLMATMNAFLAQAYAIVWPAAFASIACLFLNLGLFRYLRDLDRQAETLESQTDDSGTGGI